MNRVFKAASAACALALSAACAEAPPPPREGGPAPSLVTVDLTGQPAALSHYLGRVVLVDFWATWCDACVAELPDLERIHASYRGRGFEVLAASMDEGGRSAVAPFALKHAIPWRIVLPDAAAVRAFGVRGLPTKYLIDRDGVVARRYVGPVDVRALEDDVRTLIEKGRS